MHGLMKTRRSGPPKVVSFKAFSEDTTICPVNTLREYERRTAELRGQKEKEARPHY